MSYPAGSPEYRYFNDPVFHQLVDTLEALVREAELTPSEIREAAMLACIHYEMRRPVRSIELTEEQYRQFKEAGHGK